jgi:predicted tellurium resistance membrane protein TerC
VLTISWIIGLTEPLFELVDRPISVRDLILIGGGLFLLWKATTEIHESLEGEEAHAPTAAAAATLGGVLVQIVLLDIVFSLDSVLTAVGMVDEVPIMIAAVVIAVGVMLSPGALQFVPPTGGQDAALAFLLLIGVTLIPPRYISRWSLCSSRRSPGAPAPIFQPGHRRDPLSPADGVSRDDGVSQKLTAADRARVSDAWDPGPRATRHTFRYR